MFSHPDLRPAAGRPPADWSAPAPYRLALGLVLAATAVPIALLVASERLERAAAERFGTVNRAGQLRYRTLELYLAGRGEPLAERGAPEAAAELAAVRAGLAAELPNQVAATDRAWGRLAADLAAGPLSRAAAEEHLRAADFLTATLEADARRAAAAAGRLFTLGAGSLGITLLAGLALCIRLRQLAVRLGEREAHFRAFMDTGPAAAFVKDEAGALLYVNRTCRDRFGLRAGTTDADHFPPDVAARLRAVDRATLDGDRTRAAEECVPEPDGQLTYWLSHKFPLHFADGRRLLGGLAIEVTAQKKLEADLRANEERLRLVVGALPTILYVVGRDGVVQIEEGRGLAALGRTAGQAVGRRLAEVAPDLPLDPRQVLRPPGPGEEAGPRSVCGLTLCGGRTYEVCYSYQRDPAGRVLAVVALASDVTDQHAQLALVQQQNRDLQTARLELERLARHDPLTGLFNRRALDERLADELARAARQTAPFCLVLADLDHFKRLNDDLGHPAGDRTLKRVAAAVRGTVREVDTAARYGGEEFCVLLPGADEAAGLAVAERLRAAVAGCDPPDRPVTASFGLAVWTPGTTGPELLAAADRALYRAKAAGRNRVMAGEPALA